MILHPSQVVTAKKNIAATAPPANPPPSNAAPAAPTAAHPANQHKTIFSLGIIKAL